MSGKKATTFIFVVLFIAAVCLFSNYILTETYHECQGFDCSVCSIIQTAKEITGATKKTGCFISLFLPALSACLSAVTCFLSKFFALTPVTLYDRLTI